MENGATTKSPAEEGAEQRRQLLGLIQQHGGQITVRGLMRAERRRFTSSVEARAALAELVAAGMAKQRWQWPGSRGGRGFEVFSAGQSVDDERSYGVREQGSWSPDDRCPDLMPPAVGTQLQETRVW